jgi:hypothetical protein
VKTFSDPAGKQWDQWRPEAREKLWGLTHKWSDCILFGGWQVTVSKDEKVTGEERYLRSGRVMGSAHLPRSQDRTVVHFTLLLRRR